MSKKPKSPDLPGMTGPGVELPKDKVLDGLGDEFISVRDKKAKLAEKITEIEKKALERMTEKGMSRYRFGDQEMFIKAGSIHIRVKTVKVGTNGDGKPEGEEDP